MDPPQNPEKQARTKRRHDPQFQTQSTEVDGSHGRGDRGKQLARRGSSRGRGRDLPIDRHTATGVVSHSRDQGDAHRRGKRPASVCPDTPERLEVVLGSS